jgi:hypothetical protein
MPQGSSVPGPMSAALRDALKAGDVPATEGGLLHEFEQRGYSIWLSGPDVLIRNHGYRWMVTLRDYEGHVEPCIAYGESAIVAMAKAYVFLSSSVSSQEPETGRS